jgi:hypothetical protein
MNKMVVIMSLACACFTAQARNSATAFSDEPNQNTAAFADRALNPVVQWNRTLLAIVRTPGAQSPTVHPTRSFAMMHAAIYDAVNSIDRMYKPYLIQVPRVSRRASEAAAADTAAHDVLVGLYPAFQTALDAQLEQLLSQIAEGVHKDQGIGVGELAAEAILEARLSDGSGTQAPPFVFGSVPGDFQSPPPNFPKPQFTEWSKVTPFALESASQFRPGSPPDLTSDTYADVFNEVKSLGIGKSSTATTDQALTGSFWNGAIQNYWNEIAQTAVLATALPIPESARLFALLNLAFADDVIAFYDAKYTYNFWRPITAIRAGDSDNNPETAADPDWLPEVGKTTPDPSYPGAHAVISASAALVLRTFFKQDQFSFKVTSEVMPGVERSFSSFSAAEQEATLSRIFAGVHFRSDLTAGRHLGQDVATLLLVHFLQPADRQHHLDLDR